MDNRVTHLVQDCFMEATSTVTFKLKAAIDLNQTTVTFQLLFGIVWSNCRNGRNAFDGACINRHYISYNTMQNVKLWSSSLTQIIHFDYPAQQLRI